MTKKLFTVPVPSLIKLGDDPLPEIRISRDGDQFTISPPANWDGCLSAGVNTEYSLVYLRVSQFSILVERETPHARFGEHIVYPSTVVRDVLAWIRVTTRQFWVGYAQGPSELSYASVMDPESERKSHSFQGAGYLQFDGNPLKPEHWADIQTRLALSELPAISQLFFCDALLAASKDDQPQAIAALGIACDIEMNSLIEDIAAAYGGALPPSGLEYKFSDLIDEFTRAKFVARSQQAAQAALAVGAFSGASFRQFSAESAKIVKALYAARGVAAHRGLRKLQVDTKQLEIDDALPSVEAFFSWSKSQRNTLKTI